MRGEGCSLHDFARNVGRWTIFAQVCAWYIFLCIPLLRATHFFSQVWAYYQLFAPSVYLFPPQDTYVPDVIHPAFFILRTCALWNNNKILLAAMLVTFLVSPKSIRHTTKASC